jgi:predicted nucleic acid-binding protein
VRFVDTNILLYAASKDPREAAKRAIALELLDAGDVAISVQVLQEFYVQATRPSRLGNLTHQQALALVEAWLRFPVQDLRVEILRAALSTTQRFQISYWDAAIVEAARALGCQEVLSEDLNAGQSYDGICVINPFRSPPTGRRRR